MPTRRPFSASTCSQRCSRTRARMRVWRGCGQSTPCPPQCLLAGAEFEYALYVFSPRPMSTLNPGQWRGFLENPAAFRSVFGGVDPHLSGVRLMGTEGGKNGSSVRLKMALTCAPSQPAVRWQRMQANTVSIELQCFGLEELSVAMQ